MPQLTCQCGKTYKVPDAAAGKNLRCKACGAAIQVPPAQDKPDDEYDLADDTSPSPPARPNPARPNWNVSQRLSDLDPSLVGGQNTVASNPGLLPISFARFARCFPLVIVIPCAFALPLVISGIGYNIPFLFLLVAAILAVPMRRFLSMKRKLHGGDLVPCLVISDRPYKIAAYTDLSTGRTGPRPAIAVRNQPLARMHGGAPEVGARLVAVAFYGGNVRDDAWQNFYPTVVNCLCDDDAGIARALNSIAAKDWAALERELEFVPTKGQGLYRVRPKERIR